MSRRKGFTLVELLVVIGIIALLISILLPTLSNARRAAQTVACASNARQLSMAIRLFAQEHRGYMPALSDKSWAYQNDPTRSIWVYRAVAGQQPVLIDWCSSLLPYLGIKGVEGFFQAPEKGSKVFICPSDPAQTMGGAYGVGGPVGPGLVVFNNMVPSNGGWPISYGVNADIGAQIDRTTGRGRFGLGDEMNVYRGPEINNSGRGLPLNGKFDKVRNAAEVLLIADCGVRYNPGQAVPGTPLDRQDAVYYTTNFMTSNNPALDGGDLGRLSGVAKTGWLQKRIPWDRHKKKINVAFADGHGEVVNQGDERRVRVSPYRF